MRTPSIFDYLPRAAAEMICKTAMSEAQRMTRGLGPIAGGALAIGAGTLAGAGAAHLGNQAYKHFSGKNIPIPYLAAAAPVLGAGLGLAYNLAQAHQLEEMRRALEAPNHKPAGSVP